jgi:ABC-type bacteriocin/lantibiotic exporter with double-glycine peptidase domain
MRKTTVLIPRAAALFRYFFPLFLVTGFWSHSNDTPQPATKIPAVSRSEIDQTCGPYCLYLLCHYYEMEIDFGEIADLLPPGPKGVSLLSLKTVAEEIGFETRCLEVQAQHISLFRSPMIVRAPLKRGDGSMGHFVVVLPRPHDGGCWIFDPAKPSAKWKWAHIEEKGKDGERYFAVLLLLPRENVASQRSQPAARSAGSPPNHAPSEENADTQEK